VKLTYTTDDSELHSIFGENWSISIPYIQRENKYGTEKLYNASPSPFFTSSIDGELATTTVTSTYAARVDNGDFRSYVFTSSSNQWLVTDKNGTQYKFGSSSSTRQDDPNNSADVYKWMLEEVRDTSSNYISYAYYKDNGQIYPSSITYTGNGSTAGIFEIDFLRESRTDTATSSLTGFAVKTNYRINEIDAKINGALVHKYALAYTTGANGSTSLLSSITETGYDESSNPTTLPATMFTYKSNTPGWTSNASWKLPIALTNNQADTGWKVLDVNGDGLPDLEYSSDISGNFVEQAYINNGHGWSSDPSWYVPVDLTYQGNDLGYKFADVNGDGLPDLIFSDQEGSSTNTAAYINNGHGWTSDSSWIPPVAITKNGLDQGWRFADVNGDGLPDLIYGNYTVGLGEVFQAYINNGHGWTSDASWAPPVLFVNQGADTGYKIVDVNGDGLADFEYSNFNGSTTSFEAWVNNGHGWTQDDSWHVPGTLTTNGADNGYRFADVNGDGLVDLEYSSDPPPGGVAYYASFINNGHGWTSDTNWNLPAVFNYLGNDQGYKVADVNSDGVADVELSDQQGASTSSAAYINNGQVVDLLTEISHPAGGKTDIQYKPVAGYLDGSNNLTNTSVPFFLNTVYKVSKSDGTTTTSLDTYNYKGGKFQYYGPFDKTFAAFAEVDKTDNAGNVTKTFYHTGSGTDSSHGEYQDDYWKIGKAYRVEQYDANSNLFQKTINKWDVATSTLVAGFVKLAQTETFAYDGQATHKDKAESYTYNNANGNQAQKVEYGQVTGSDDGTFTDTGSDLFTTYTAYATSVTSTLLTLPDDVTVTDQSANKVKESKFYYDSLAFGVIDKGNQTEQDDWKTATAYVVSTKAYNGYGLVATSTDPRGKVTSYVYDAYNLYPATTTKPLSLVSQATYNYATGKVDETIDENGNKFLNTYDGLGRPTLVQQPDPSVTSSLLTRTAYAYNDATSSVSVHQTDYLNSATTVDSYTYYDGLNRSKQVRKSAEFGYFETKDLAYNNIGLLQQESLPYFSSSSANTTATTVAALFTTYTYDALQRTVTTANAVGTTTRAYVNWKTTVTDANGKTKDLINDAYGNLTEVDEHNATSTYVTTYAYNGLNALTNLTDALGNVRNFTYDGLARRLTAQDLHASSDATFGTWTYTYDDSGNLTQVVDPKSQTVNRTYDDLNRILTEDYTGQAGTEVSYVYDSCTQGLTRLCTASSAAVTVNNTYNALGQLTQESKTISGTSTSFVTAYTYDRQGNQLSITNPDNSQVQYSYNVGGRVETIQHKEATDAAFSNVVTDFDYSPTGKVSFQANANCTQTTNTYDPNQLYRLTNKLTTNPCQQVAPRMMPLRGPGNTAMAQAGSLMPTTTALGWNSKTGVSNGGAGNNYEFHAKQVNFKDADGTFKTIDVTPVATATGWEVTQNTFIATFPARSTGAATMVNNNRFDTRTLTDINEPIQTMTITASAVADVAGVLEYGDVGYGSEWYVRYAQAYPASNADLIYLVWQGKVPRLQKLVRFNSAPSSNTDFGFQYTYPDKDPDFISSTGVKWNKASKLSTNRAVSVGKAGDKHGFGMKDFKIWDSGIGAKRMIAGVNVDITSLGGNSYILTKHIPLSFFTGSPKTFPVFTDTTITVYPDPDPETNTVDGQLQRFVASPGTNWSGIRDGAGTSAFPDVANQVFAAVSTYPSGTCYAEMDRAIFLFDTSSLGAGATITSSTLSLYGEFLYNDSAASPTYNIYTSNPASNTDLVASDFGNLGTTQQATSIAQASLVSGAYNTWTLNATGLSNISPTGITKFGYREATYDAANSDPGLVCNKSYQSNFDYADAAGTSKDPKLVVVSTTGSVGTVAQVIQNITYTYDAVGNITKIVNASPTDASSTVTYAYDDLYRLTSASLGGVPTGVSGYGQTYVYDALGNILNKSDLGSYGYATGTTPGYANPDAVISLPGLAQNYDNNGNLLTVTSSGWRVNGGKWNRRMPITINHAKVSGSSNLINFSILFSATSTEFKSATNSGYVALYNGADIFFTASDGMTKLNHELESYTATSGSIVAWVQVPVISTATDTVLYMYYGNASSVSQQAKAATWDSNYVGVYHLPNGSTLTANDSTVNANNGVVSSVSATSGQFYGAAGFSGSTSSYVTVADNASLEITKAVTLSGWLYLNGTSFSGNPGLIRKGSTSAASPNNYMLQGVSGGRLVSLTHAHASNSNDSISSSGSVASNSWTYLSAVIDTQNNFRGIYLNGVLDTSSSVSAEAMSTSTDPVWLGKRQDAGLNGRLDEVRISNTARSADWIKTEYTNETTSTFFTLGSATGVATTTTYFTWDYLNRLTKVGAGTTTSTYAYDPWGQRVRVAVATSTTATSYYPTKFYNSTYGIPTKHIFANGEVVADVIGTATSATTSYVHVDHLGGSNVLTDGNGAIGELLDYQPYGSSRLDEKTSFNEQRKFIGEQYDAASGLSYLNARYYNGSNGRFISEDPTFLGDPKSQDLTNPQSLNSYNYANGNPITNRDPSGKCIDACVGETIALGVGTAPLWYPVLYYASQQLVRGSVNLAQRLWGGTWGGQRPEPNVGWPSRSVQGGDPSGWNPKIPDGWKIVGGILTLGVVGGLLDCAYLYNGECEALNGADNTKGHGVTPSPKPSIPSAPGTANPPSNSTARPQSQGASSSSGHSFSSNCGASGSFCSPAFQRSPGGKLTPILK
jgi:RHS repeat-associated protein